MDGVLVNNLDIHRQAFAEFFRRYGVERPFENLSRLFGKGNDDIMGELMPRDIVERVGIRELGNHVLLPTQLMVKYKIVIRPFES